MSVLLAPTPSRTLDDARAWVREGNELLKKGVAGLGEEGFAADSLLPGWTRKHVIAHLAANAEALGNLVSWAKTGVKTPMYASKDAREAGIQRGAALSAVALDSWLATSAEALDEAWSRLTEEQWQHEVETAQGRTVPATEIPWMRAREVCVHAVDLDRGIGFETLSEGFLRELGRDICAKRGLTEDDLRDVDGPLPEVVAWLAGRPHGLTGTPDLGPWL